VAVWGISDLHLSLARPERRERFAGRWRDHVQKLERLWRENVAQADLVLLPGDLSMAKNHRDLQPDLAWLERLPGTKVISAGNHDQWWNSVEAIRPLLRSSIRAVGGDAIATHGVVVCGARGAPVPGEDDDPALVTSAEAELASLEQALAEAARLRQGEMPLYVLWHFPPFDQHRRPGPWVERIEAARATACLYGHLHIEAQWPLAVQGEMGGVRYYCVSADAVGFRPLRVDRGCA
jgi:predicted phosphohydrolase